MELIVGLVRASREDAEAAGWVAPELRHELRRNPFTNQVEEFAVWRPISESSAAETTFELTTVPLDVAVLSSPEARENAALQGGLLHEGMLIELWAPLLGETEAINAWKPAFLRPDMPNRSLFRFPEKATQRLARCDIRSVAEVWAKSGYFENFYLSSSPSAALDILNVITDCVRTGTGDLYAVSRGYVSA